MLASGWFRAHMIDPLPGLYTNISRPFNRLGQRALLAIGDFLVVTEKLQPADVIHVLSGEDYRTDFAVQLYQRGYGKQIFFTGGWCIYHQYFHGAHGRERALALGVPAAAIASDESEVTSTYAEAVRLKAFLQESQPSSGSVIVVSDPHHMRRARWAYSRVLGNHFRLQMAHMPFDQSLSQRCWWRDARSRKMVGREYQKFIYYLARYQWSRGPLQAWLASFDKE
jgi:uncharacterized SAM-binding protein YcdF (DUF218 family)